MSEDSVERILTGLSGVKDSVSTLTSEFSGMKAQQRSTEEAVRELKREVKDFGETTIRLDGRTKGLKDDVGRIESSMAERISGLKTEDIPVIVRGETSKVIQTHEEKFKHNLAPSVTSTTLKQLEENTRGKVIIPRNIILVGVFVGAAMTGAAIFILKSLFGIDI